MVAVWRTTAIRQQCEEQLLCLEMFSHLDGPGKLFSQSAASDGASSHEEKTLSAKVRTVLVISVFCVFVCGLKCAGLRWEKAMSHVVHTVHQSELSYKLKSGGF